MHNQAQNRNSYSEILSFPASLINLNIRFQTLNGKLIYTGFLPTNSPLKHANDPTTQSFVDPLSVYHSRHEVELHTPLLSRGSDVQPQVWRVSKTVSPDQIRDVGITRCYNRGTMAAGENPCRADATPIFILCHRMMMKNGLGVCRGQTRINGWE